MASDLGVGFDDRRYLKDSPTREELAAVLAILEDPPGELVRKDKKFKDLGLDPDDFATADAVADLLAEHPALIQRPVLVRPDKAIIGRPKDRVGPFLRGE